MEDSMKGLLVSLGLLSLFIMGILNFIVYFPQEQGVTFDNDSKYLETINITNYQVSSSLANISNSTFTSYDEWDLEVGWMGSNTQKGSTGTIVEYKDNIFTVLTSLAEQVFSTKEGVHPVLYVIGTLGAMVGIYIIFLAIKLARSGY